MSSSNSRHEVVIDAGPIIALARLDLLGLPAFLFRGALATGVVVDECLANPRHPEHLAIRTALEKKQLSRVDWMKPTAMTMWNLDRGEASTIDLAASQGANVLVDDLAARRVAKSMGLNTIGTCGLLLEARHRELILAVRPLLDELARSGYYLSESLIETVCRLAGEA